MIRKGVTTIKQRVLLVDDEENIRMLVRFNLEKAGYEVIEAGDGKQALALARNETPDIAILDLMLPGIDGLEVCRLLKQSPETAALPIIMLTAKGDEIDRVIGLELGADDYMAKPFSQRELAARIKAVLRRPALLSEKSDEIVLGKLRMNFNRYEAQLDGQKLDFTPKEYELLKLFAENVAPHVKIKAAGGISSLADAEKFIELGASRLGTSRIVKIAKQLEK